MDENAQLLDNFDDVRAIQKHLQENEITLDKTADVTTIGPESIFLKDPDGNVILIDQHV